ncbi:MAG: tetratricopeptide repeat protein [Acidobacteria bacterium]|nr:tetratricopeptide repeat protein [Acidobacteriota bacterium]
MKIDQKFLSQLKEDVAARRIERGIAGLRAHETLLDQLHPGMEHAAPLLGYLAQWVDIGFSKPARLREILKRFDVPVRLQLPVNDYLYVRLAEGMVAMAEQCVDNAIAHFDVISTLGAEWNDKQSLAIAHFWKGRCLRMKGEYDKALSYTVRGKDLAAELGLTCMAAVMQVLESWLLFQKGKLKEASAISHEAETALAGTDDHVALGNIYSFYGRVARREGRYDSAIDYFQKAIEEFKKRDPKHPNLARSLANMALAKRGIALQLRRRIDRDVERQRKAGSNHDGKRAPGRIDYRQHLEQLRKEALSHLDEATEIYRGHPSRHGVATVHLNYGYLHLDNGDYHLAEDQSATAFRLAKEQHDFIIMGRARILQCMIENAKVEEEISEGADPGSHARRALEYIQEGVELAKRTQNRRVLTSAYLWQGFTHCNAFFDSPESARESYDLAVGNQKGDLLPDNMWRDLQTLRAKILQKSTIDPKLKAWSQGSVGDKTFQQISEEFAELIIPRVWESEGRKISRVATRLSISPKKVRRILTRSGRLKPNKS